MIMDKTGGDKKWKAKLKIYSFIARWFNWLIISTVVLIFVGGFFFLLWPKYKEIKAEAELSGSAKEDEFWQKKKQLNKIKEIKKSFAEISKEDVAKIKSMLPEESGEDALLADLESVTTKNGLILVNLQTEKKVADTGKSSEVGGLPREIGKIKIFMDVVGVDYENLKNILSIMENNLRVIDITKLDFSPAESKVSFEALAYYLVKK